MFLQATSTRRQHNNCTLAASLRRAVGYESFSHPSCTSLIVVSKICPMRRFQYNLNIVPNVLVVNHRLLASELLNTTSQLRQKLIHFTLHCLEVGASFYLEVVLMFLDDFFFFLWQSGAGMAAWKSCCCCCCELHSISLGHLLKKMF